MSMLNAQIQMKIMPCERKARYKKNNRQNKARLRKLETNPNALLSNYGREVDGDEGGEAAAGV